MVEHATGVNPWVEWARMEVARLRAERYTLPLLRCDHAGILVCLAHQEHPDLSAYADPEVVWRLRKNDALRDAFLPSLKRFNPQFDPTWV
ncbi:MAG: hypothetical protein ACUVR3_04630 [Candidatus Roseilinea sp.]